MLAATVVRAVRVESGGEDDGVVLVVKDRGGDSDGDAVLLLVRAVMVMPREDGDHDHRIGCEEDQIYVY